MLSDLDRADVALGVVQDSVKAADANDALQSGKVKALVAGSPIAHCSEALAVRRGDLAFLAFLNDWIQARSDDGWLKARADQWFGNLDWAAAK